MEIKDFATLSLKEKKEYLQENGKYIVTRDYYSQRVDLYYLQDYFVEIWYHIFDGKDGKESSSDDKFKFALINKVQPLTDDKDLDIYIELYKKNNYEVF